jgi:hypothetical protein
MSSAPTCFALAFCLLTTGTLAAQHLWTLAFDEDRADQPPVGFSLGATRQADAGRWLVERSGGSGHLVHRADPAAPGFALAVADRPAPPDAAVSVRLRFAGASRAGGLVWHYRDDLNYNALLLDLNRGELSVYRITAGNRVRLDVRDELELDPAAWHALKVIHQGNEIRVMLGGIRVFDEQDRRGDRESTGGRVGMLATGASEIWFDDLSVEAKRGHR